MPHKTTRRWHFRDPKFQDFLGEHAPLTPLIASAKGANEKFLLVRTSSKSHATALERSYHPSHF